MSEVVGPESFLDAQGRWACTKCGACCRAIGCPLLTQGNLCSIYSIRPPICRTENFPMADQTRAEACYSLWRLVYGQEEAA